MAQNWSNCNFSKNNLNFSKNSKILTKAKKIYYKSPRKCLDFSGNPIESYEVLT
jgi:hypothetical protein